MEHTTVKMQMAVQLLLEYLLEQKDTLLELVADQKAQCVSGTGNGAGSEAIYVSSSPDSSSSGMPGSSSTSN